MKIAILSQDSNLYSTRRLKEAGEARGHEMRVIHYLRCYMNINRTSFSGLPWLHDYPLQML
jgi:glutathione synthase/RimK-type ligase-like ATP-grasp enzyme